jgi:hypothetical protein
VVGGGLKNLTKGWKKMAQTKAGAAKAQQTIRARYGVTRDGKSITHVKAGASVKTRGKGGGFRNPTVAQQAGKKGGGVSRLNGNRSTLSDKFTEIRGYALTHSVSETIAKFKIPIYAVYVARKYRTFQGYRYEVNKAYEKRVRKYSFIKNADAKKPFSDGINPEADIRSNAYALNSIDEMNGKHKPVWAKLLGWSRW